MRMSVRVQVSRFHLLSLLLLLTAGDTEAQRAIPPEAHMISPRFMAEADSLFDSRKYEEAVKKYVEIIIRASSREDNSAMTEATAMVARSYLAMDKKEEGRRHLKGAANIAVPEESLGWSRYLGVRGRFEWKDNQLDKAAATFKEMYQYCSDNKLHERAIDAANMMTIVGGPEEQIEWGLKGIREAEAANSARWLAPLWNNLGWTYEHSGKYAEAVDAYQRAREYHYQHGDQKNKLCADWALGHAYRLNGDTAKAAIWITPELLAGFEALADTEFQGWTLKEMGEIALLQSRSDSALHLLERAEEKLRAADMPNWDAEGYKKLVEQIQALK